MFGILDGCTVGRESVGVWLSLWLVGRCVAKPDAGFLDVSWHGEVYLPQFVIPIQCESKISYSIPIHVDFVILAENAGEVVHVALLMYCTPKLSTTRVKLIGHHSWRQNPGVTVLWRYPA